MQSSIMKNLKELEGKTVTMTTHHKIYGDEEFRCVLNLFQEEDKIGFLVSNHKIYLYNDEIESIEIGFNIFKIFGKLLSITIAII